MLCSDCAVYSSVIRYESNLEFKVILGGEEENFEFTMGPNTSAYRGCSAKLNGEMFVFGGDGSKYNKQVMRF